MSELHTGKPNLPPEAENEILAMLFTDMKISSKDIAAILKKHGVSGDVESLQDSYRKRLGQRLMSSIRDENGRREVLAHHGEYIVMDCCNDRQTLRLINHRMESQAQGLDVSAWKVQGRIRFLNHLISCLQRRGAK